MKMVEIGGTESRPSEGNLVQGPLATSFRFGIDYKAPMFDFAIIAGQQLVDQPFGSDIWTGHPRSSWLSGSACSRSASFPPFNIWQAGAGQQGGIVLMAAHYRALDSSGMVDVRGTRTTCGTRPGATPSRHLKTPASSNGQAMGRESAR